MGTVGAAAGVFAGTNVDDLIVLTVLFLASRSTGRPARWQIVVGQYLGIAALTGVSAVAALGLVVIPEGWVGWLGLLPLALGVWGLFKARDGEQPAVANGLLPVAGVTIANGADNISVYTPVFRSLGVGDSVVMMAVFAVGVAVWCLVASWLGGHQRVISALERVGHWLVPVVFIAIGAVILLESGVVGRLF